MELPIKVKPYNHQKIAFDFALEKLEQNGCAALLMDMGLGKSLTSIAIIGQLYKEQKIDKALVVCPTSIISVWQKEFDKFADFEYHIEAIIGSTMTKRKEKLKALCHKQGLKVAIINYEATWRMERELNIYKPNIIVCDESQKIKNPSASQSKTLHRLGAKATYKIILTGTPVQNSPMDVFSQWKFLDPNIFGLSFYAFRNRYAVMGGYYNHQIIKYRNMDELTSKAHSIAYRITKGEALDLPEQIFLNRYCELESSARKVYDTVMKESYAELMDGEITATNILTKLIRLSQISGGHVKDDEGRMQVISKAKLNELKDIMEDVIIDNKKKLVVFARFIPEIESIKQLADEMRIRYSYITGEIKTDDRGIMCDNFQNDEDVKLFIAQIQTAGLGITLTAADTAVFYSLDFNYANYSQAIARTHRIGQKNTCTYINLISTETVDEKIIKALESKEDIAKNIVDNWREYFKKGE
ncbi:MAG: DEAD/DEAH box helicase [Lachnospiraceae bacterium]|nr:DEAD/DEAH box helicase [Lachnospiraceae bacterium]